MPVGTVRYWAAARTAAGITDEPYDASTLAEVLAQIRARHGASLGRILDSCSFLVDDAPVGRREPTTVAVRDGGTVEVLPPFAGGA